MTAMQRRVSWLVLAALLGVGLVGCGSGGPQYVKVSGMVTFNGKAYKNAIVTFQPVATADAPNPGRGSYGHTDENGKFSLVVDANQSGAVVGKHKVRISTTRANWTSDWDPALGTPDGIDPKLRPKIEIDPIPAEWNTDSKKEFDVPRGGTDQANFDIIGRKK